MEGAGGASSLSAADLLLELDRLNQASYRGLSLLDSLAYGVKQWDETDGAAEEDLCEGLQEQLLEDDDDDDRVESMWDNFEVENYAPQPVRVPRPQPKRWNPEVTVPKPFSFADRPPTKSKSVQEYEAELARRRAEEDAECNVRIRANPVPASTRHPLLAKLGHQSHSRGVDKIPPPKPSSRPNCTCACRRRETTLDDLEALQRVQEMERARRAKEMLAKARAPADLDKRGHRRVAEGPQYPFRPVINDGIPDYDKMASEFESKLSSVRARRQPTRPEPFKFRSDRLPSSKGKVRLDMEMDDMQLPETRWPFVASRTKPKRHPHGPKAQAYLALSEAAQAPDPPTTRAAEIRAAAVKRQQRERVAQQQREVVGVERRKSRAQRLQPSIAATTLRNDVAERQKQNRLRMQRERTAVERALELQYQAELALMKDRVERRPLLSEAPIVV